MTQLHNLIRRQVTESNVPFTARAVITSKFKPEDPLEQIRDAIVQYSDHQLLTAELKWVLASECYEGPYHKAAVARFIIARYLQNKLIQQNVCYTGDPDKRYRYLGKSIGAGTSKGEVLEVYWDPDTNTLFHRTPGDYRDRIQDAK